MDRLVVLDGGRIVEQGTHAELLATQGAYAALWEHQSGGFLDDLDGLDDLDTVGADRRSGE
jgi:ATP-binding cassette subfamily B protein